MSRALRFVMALWMATAFAAEPDGLRVARLVVAEGNHARDDARVPSLVPDARLVRAAQAFADYLARHDRFDHDADGRTPMQRATAEGYPACRVAENIAYEYRSRGFESEALSKVLVRDWMESRRPSPQPARRAAARHRRRHRAEQRHEALVCGAAVRGEEVQLNGYLVPHISTLMIALPMPVSAAPEMSPAQIDS